MGNDPFDDVSPFLISAKNFDNASAHRIQDDVREKQLPIKTLVSFQHEKKGQDRQNHGRAIQLRRMKWGMQWLGL